MDRYMDLLTLLNYFIALIAKQIKMVLEGLGGHKLVSKFELWSLFGKLVWNGTKELTCKFNWYDKTI